MSNDNTLTKIDLLLKINELVENENFAEAKKLQSVLLQSIKNDRKQRLYSSTVDLDRRGKKIAMANGFMTAVE